MTAPAFLGAQEETYLSRWNLGVETGVWKPSTLDDHPSKPFKNVTGARPYIGITLSTPSFENFALRLSIMPSTLFGSCSGKSLCSAFVWAINCWDWPLADSHSNSNSATGVPINR